MTEDTPAPAFKVGDVVRLKSGGLPMTVMHLRSEKSIDCVWQDQHGTPHGYAYPTEILVIDPAEAIIQRPADMTAIQRWPEPGNTDWKTSRGL